MMIQCAHGGDIYENCIQHDFSVNVNPLPLPPQILECAAAAAKKSNVYPQYGNGLLKARIASVLHVSCDCVLCGNGASELFVAIVHALRPTCTAILVPSFSGYVWAAQMEGEVRPISLHEEDGFAVTEEVVSQLKGVQLLILASPNNPTGRFVPHKMLETILAVCKKNDIFVVLDECFAGFTGKEDAKKFLQHHPHLILVRAFTKLYGVPGLRLGYLLAEPKLCSSIAHHLPEWNVSLPAQEMGLAVLDENWDREKYIAETIRIIQEERVYLKHELIKIFGEDLTVFPSDANFLLLKTKFPLYRMLLRRGILIRDCSNYAGLSQGYYRIAVKAHADNVLLLQTMKEEMRKI